MENFIIPSCIILASAFIIYLNIKDEKKFKESTREPLNGPVSLPSDIQSNRIPEEPDHTYYTGCDLSQGEDQTVKSSFFMDDDNTIIFLN